MKQPLNCFRGCCKLSFVESHFPFRKLSIFCGSLRFCLACQLRGFPVAFRLLGFSWLASSVTAFQLSPSCLRCPLEFLAVAFDPYLFGSDLLAFIALKVLSNNHLHLLVIRFAFVVVQLSSFGLAVFGFVVC